MGQSRTYDFDGQRLACTNVDRVVFPPEDDDADDGITKGEVIDYHIDFAAYLLPEIGERPLSIERYTKGLAGGGFFQKHIQKHYPDWIERAELGIKTRVVYPIINTAAGLAYMANQGALAMHIWTSRRGAPDHPDLLVFDLDPPDGRFDLVRQTALLIHELFDELDLPAFVKTSGSKGLHVCAPTDGEASYAETIALCTRIAKLLCARHPDVMTLEFYKKDRKGRLFLDLLRNAHGATFIAPYSLRGRKGAPISAPIEWEEVEDPALAPDGIRLRDLRARLDRLGDPWSGFRRTLASVEAAGKRLAKLERRASTRTSATRPT
ncbi:MAG: non-homologous end-joining DNA ligase [Proteobacteria bacterium]|nr:non-homologous end-joining DNA ligase [Pseudomonadota bacterium]